MTKYISVSVNSTLFSVVFCAKARLEMQFSQPPLLLLSQNAAQLLPVGWSLPCLSNSSTEWVKGSTRRTTSKTVLSRWVSSVIHETPSSSASVVVTNNGCFVASCGSIN